MKTFKVLTLLVFCIILIPQITEIALGDTPNFYIITQKQDRIGYALMPNLARNPIFDNLTIINPYEIDLHIVYGTFIYDTNSSVYYIPYSGENSLSVNNVSYGKLKHITKGQTIEDLEEYDIEIRVNTGEITKAFIGGIIGSIIMSIAMYKYIKKKKEETIIDDDFSGDEI